MKVPTLSLEAVDEWLSTLPPETLFARHSPHKCAIAEYLNANDKSEDRISGDWRVGYQYVSKGPNTETQIRMSTELTRFIIWFAANAAEPAHRKSRASAKEARELIKRLLNAKIKKTPHSSE